jgi:segregation and condensation protein A
LPGLLFKLLPSGKPVKLNNSGHPSSRRPLNPPITVQIPLISNTFAAVMTTATNENFEVKLPLFEGPFDLLLFFIERDELDIYDIPIAKITNDFLDYLHHLDTLNVEVASEFILVAATLMRIKSKMLLPRPQLDEQGNEIDPREELVKHLLEYKKYKSVVETLQKMEETELMKEKRGNLIKEIKALAESSNVEAELQDVDLFKLMNVFEKVLKRFEAVKNKPVHQVIQYPYTIEEQKNYLLSEVSTKKRISFVDIVATYKTRIALIFNFLAILELLAIGRLGIQVGEGYNNFWITSSEPEEEAQP